MKIKFKNLHLHTLKINEKKSPDSWDDEFGEDDYYWQNADNNYSSRQDDEEEEERDYPEQNIDEMDEEEHLCYLIRSMFTNYGLNAQVHRDDLDLTIYIFLKSVEKMKNILKVFDVVSKLKRDILPQYDSEVELYESKQGFPVFKFDFYYGVGDKDDNLPF